MDSIQQIERWRAESAAERAAGKKPRRGRVSRGRAEREYQANPDAYYAGRVAGETVRISPRKEIK